MWIGIASVFCALLVAFLSSFEKLTVTHNNKRKPTRAGWILIVSSLLGLALQLSQVVSSEIEKQSLQDSLTSKISQINAYTNSSNRSYSQPILNNQELARKAVDTVKEGVNDVSIKLNSLGANIIKIPTKSLRDAEFFVTNIDPKYRSDSFMVDIFVMAKYNTANDVNTNVYPLLKLADGSFEYFGSLNKMKAATMMQDEKMFLKLAIHKKFKSPVDLVYLKIVGSYKTQNKIKPINNFIRCDVRQGFFADTFSDADADMIAEYKKHNVNIPL